jgi:hypothetical protein
MTTEVRDTGLWEESPAIGQQGRVRLPPPGFGEFDVPEMPAYTQGYASRGNAFTADSTPVKMQTRFGNRRGRGGMGAYLSRAEDDMHFADGRTRRGNMGVFDATRWTVGYDGRGGVAALAEIKNFPGMMTRGGELRRGGPRRGDVLERPGAWFERAQPFSRTTATWAGPYPGIREPRRLTPHVETEPDPFVLREMIEHNPFHIRSHAAREAKRRYDAEVPPRG